MIQFKYISNISEEELNTNFVIPCTNEKMFPCILIMNSKQKNCATGYSTDNLEIKLNRELNNNGKKYYVHIIEAKKTDLDSKKQFEIIYEYVFKKIDTTVSDSELSSLIYSLEEFFKLTPDKDTKQFQVGLYGELITIKYLYDLGFKNIINYYHMNFYSKHDIELSEKCRIEVKTSVSEKRIHHFKHNQITRKDIDVIVSSVLLEESKIGVSLKEMIDIIISIAEKPDYIFFLRKLAKKAGIDSENYGMVFSYEKVMSDIRFYDVNKIPKIPDISFEGITNIEYDVDCSNCNYYKKDELYCKISNII